VREISAFVEKSENFERSEKSARTHLDGPLRLHAHALHLDLLLVHFHLEARLGHGEHLLALQAVELRVLGQLRAWGDVGGMGRWI
jgi:hypothetical protein